MKKVLIFLFTQLLVLSILGQPKNSLTKLDNSFNRYKEQFVLDYWKQFPGQASGQGFHNYDSVLIIPNDNARASKLKFCTDQLKKLKSYNVKALSENNKIEYYMIETQLQSIQWYNNAYKSYKWNPAEYNVCGDFAEMLANDYEPLDTRIKNYYIKLKNVPAYYEAAKKNIENPTLEHTQLAIAQNTGGLSAFNEDLNTALEKSTLTDLEKRAVTQRATAAADAVKDYATFLKNYKNDNPKSFRLGKELYYSKFNFDIESGYTAPQIYQIAVDHKKELHIKMYAITKRLWPKYMKDAQMPSEELKAIRQLIDVISLKHISVDSFQTEIERQIPTLVDFVKQKNLLYIDPSKPLVVRKEPAYMAGVAGASVSAPGPYDKNGNTYYNVGSITNWDKDRAESYLREYNYYILQILNIHEAIPGHYTQLVYANKSPGIIKAIFGNGAMIEGWAVYTELMMLENGYGSDPATGSDKTTDEMMLMYYKWNLRVTCNTILDYDVHVNNLSREDAMKLLTEEAFQQKAEADGKWNRVSLSQVQLCSYFTGYTEIYNFREALKKKQGKKFNLKAFHEKFLSYGNAPVKYIKMLMDK